MLELEHISGDFFLAEKLDIDTRDRERLRTSFQVEDGRGEEMCEETIWFERDDGSKVC
jgi:hypothetical protein